MPAQPLGEPASALSLGFDFDARADHYFSTAPPIRYEWQELWKTDPYVGHRLWDERGPPRDAPQQDPLAVDAFPFTPHTPSLYLARHFHYHRIITLAQCIFVHPQTRSPLRARFGAELTSALAVVTLLALSATATLQSLILDVLSSSCVLCEASRMPAVHGSALTCSVLPPIRPACAPSRGSVSSAT